MSSHTEEFESPFFLLAGYESCWKCGNSSRVVGLASGDATSEPYVLQYIKAMPEAFLTEIHKLQPQLEYRLSQAIDASYFMNFCSCCGASIGDHYIFSQPGGAFFPITDEDTQHIEVNELPFLGSFSFECSPAQGIVKDIIQQGTRVSAPPLN
jgi:hypothetical protein